MPGGGASRTRECLGVGGSERRACGVTVRTLCGKPCENLAPPRRSYGEDPVHVSAMGVAHTLALQNRSAPTPTGDYFVQLSQVSRRIRPASPGLAVP